MEILGIGLPEILFIVLLALILLGPKDMVKAGRTIGRSLRKFITSPAWRAMQTTGHEIQQLPTKLMREAGLEELQDLEEEVRSTTNQIRPSSVGFDEKQIFDSTIHPPAAPPPKEPESPSMPPTEPKP
jgi:Sec-independent protein translocase protein TatA